MAVRTGTGTRYVGVRTPTNRGATVRTTRAGPVEGAARVALATVVACVLAERVGGQEGVVRDEGAAGGTGAVAGRAGFDPRRWVINRNMRFAVSRSANGKERRVLVMERGARQVAFLRDVQFTDGTIEFEFKGGRWLGLAFRVRHQGRTAEIIYFRNPKIAGWRRSIRYYARHKDQITKQNRNGELEGSSVESGTIPLPPTVQRGNTKRLLDARDWVRVKCVIRGSRAVVFLNGSPKPAFTISKLAFPKEPGSVGLYGWDGAFAGFRFRKLTP